jgi:hypothetical protein
MPFLAIIYPFSIKLAAKIEIFSIQKDVFVIFFEKKVILLIFL